MTPTIVVNGKEFLAFHWFEAPLPHPGETVAHPHFRDRDLLEKGVSDLRPGEVRFKCDQTIAFDTTFALKGDGRKFVVISNNAGEHVAKPY